MLSLTQLGEMTPEARTDLFDSLMDQIWPDSPSKAQTAAQHLGCTPQTYYGWRRKHTVPETVLLLLQEWAAPGHDYTEARMWREVTGDLSELASTIQLFSAQIGQLADRLERMADHRALAQGQSVSGAGPRGPGSRLSSAE